MGDPIDLVFGVPSIEEVEALDDCYPAYDAEWDDEPNPYNGTYSEE